MKILFATDGSEYSMEAAEFLKRLILSKDDEIIVTHVISDVPFKDDRESYYTSLKRIKQEIAPKILDSTIERMKGIGAALSTALFDGHPDRVIVEAATDSDSELIVLGARGLKGIRSLFLGSVTRSVAINSTRPVLVITPKKRKTDIPLKILYATDGSDSAFRTGKLITKIPFHENSEIKIINVIPTSYMDVPEMFWLEVNERVKSEIAAIRERELDATDRILKDASDMLSERFKNIEVMIKFGDPSEEILRVSREIEADVIATGSSGMRGIKGMLGSVSRNILVHSECSVLIGK